MYYHNEYTHQVNWAPKYEQLAVTAMRDIVVDSFEANDGPIEVDLKTAEQINARYQELLTNDPEIDYPPEDMIETNEETQ